jgi:hypothetical protein
MSTPAVTGSGAEVGAVKCRMSPLFDEPSSEHSADDRRRRKCCRYCRCFLLVSRRVLYCDPTAPRHRREGSRSAKCPRSPSGRHALSWLGPAKEWQPVTRPSRACFEATSDKPVPPSAAASVQPEESVHAVLARKKLESERAQEDAEEQLEMERRYEEEAEMDVVRSTTTHGG